jgi:hypothetical protein
MVEVDVVLKDVVILKEGYLDIRDLYKLIQTSLKNMKYPLLVEKEHSVISNKVKIKLDAKKALNDYTRLVLKTTIEGSNIKKIKLKSKETYEGKFKVKLESEIEKDYEDEYEGKPIFKFFRELFDYIVKASDFSKFNKMSKNDLYILRDEIKAYFEIEKFE